MKRKKSFKFLTMMMSFLILSALYQESFAAVLTQENTQTHLRWIVNVKKNHLNIDKKGSRVLLRTLNSELFDKVATDLKAISKNKSYFKSINVNPPGTKNNVSTIEVVLKDENIEMFSFYKDRETKYVIDFWIDKESENDTVSQIEKKSKRKGSNKKGARAAKVEAKKIIMAKKPKVLPKLSKKPTKRKRKKVVVNPGYRDFRYGAPFFWNYGPLNPEVKRPIRLDRKTPEYFYPIKNRKLGTSEKETHLQLNINLFRKEKWGLMYKSINLYHQKYGDEDEIDFNEYLKANALFRENFNKGNAEPVKMAVSILGNIAERTKIYDLEKGISKYLITYSIENKEYVESLRLAKKFYVSSKENFDYEESNFAAESILYSLTQLNQLEKVRALLKEKTIKKILPKQTMLAYELFTYLKLGKEGELLRAFKKAKSSLTKPTHEAILFNVAESFFREANYKSAIKYFDEFLTHYSYHQKAGEARLRIALAFEILNKPIKETLVLYKNAINRSANIDVAFEARLRYVALRSIRKLKTNNYDKEIRIFLDPKEKQIVSKESKKLLWLVRLRTFIVDEKFEQALSYLKAIPLTGFTPSEKRVFEADGAEIIYGIINDFYARSDYSEAIKVWETYKNKYIRKVANDPYMNYIVGKSYLKIGLYDGFEKTYSDFIKLKSSPNRTFPNWVNRNKSGVNFVIEELPIIKNIKLKNWSAANRGLLKLQKINPRFNKLNYYHGIITFNQNKYFESAQAFEAFLSNQRGSSQFEPHELAEMLTAYSDSLFELKKLKKFQKISDAVLNDTEKYRPSNPFIKNLRERLSYLGIEILAGKGTKKAYLQAEPKIVNFLKDYKKSAYLGRVKYLLGLSLINNEKEKKGRDLFQKILGDQTIPNTIKELVKSELSLLRIKEKSI